jgi:hypothetical protein
MKRFSFVSNTQTLHRKSKQCFNRIDPHFKIEFQPECIGRDKDESVAQTATFRRKNFSQENERDVSVTHRKVDVD